MHRWNNDKTRRNGYRRERDREEARLRNVPYASGDPSSGKANTSAFSKCPSSAVAPRHFHSLSSLFYFWTGWIRSLNTLPQTMIATMQARIARFFSPPAVFYAASVGIREVLAGESLQTVEITKGGVAAESDVFPSSVPILYVGVPVMHSATTSLFESEVDPSPGDSHSEHSGASYNLTPKYILDDAGCFVLRHQLESFLAVPYDTQSLAALARADSSDPHDPTQVDPDTLPWSFVRVILPFPKWDGVHYTDVRAAPELIASMTSTEGLSLLPFDDPDVVCLRLATRSALTMGFEDDTEFPAKTPWDETDILIAERTMETCQAANRRSPAITSLHTLPPPSANDPQGGDVLAALIPPGTYIVGSSKNPLVKSYRSAHTLPNEPKLAPCKTTNRSLRATRNLVSALYLTAPDRVPPSLVADLTRNAPSSTDKPALFLSVDLEAHDIRPDRIIEVGWTIYDAKTRRVYTRHAVVREHAHYRNGKWVRDEMGEFAYGDLEVFRNAIERATYKHPDELPHVMASEIAQWRERGTMVLPLLDTLELCLRDVSEAAGVVVEGKLYAVSKKTGQVTVSGSRPPVVPAYSPNTSNASHGLLFSVPDPEALRPVHLVGAEPPSDFAFLRSNGIDLPQILAANPAFEKFDWRLFEGFGAPQGSGSNRVEKEDWELERDRGVPGMDLSDPLMEYDMGGPLWYDVSDIWHSVSGTSWAKKVGLEKILHSLSIPLSHLHNAGNDSHLSMAAFLRMLEVYRSGASQEGHDWAQDWRLEWDDVRGGSRALDEAEIKKDQQRAATLDALAGGRGSRPQDDEAGLPSADVIAADLVRALRSRFVAPALDVREEDVAPEEPLWPKPEECVREVQPGWETSWGSTWGAEENENASPAESSETPQPGGWDQEVNHDWANGWSGSTQTAEPKKKMSPWWEGRGRGKSKGKIVGRGWGFE
ncbi:hypothetical protein M427DRAFT_27120 [Gonapodya prolifera JEL478]|uniref:Gfd2/YDR514C-like C-terminal domain-containing protein n=1 Tax=Gonapodya prolifera (strain JEL478) TaxID=1344416 RepID=A0A139AXK1_GONPJ|nr:hypothetical protein M427DRAFT_27120 [Gonapodya prolifera JEL478]|eukprot:KXS21458.1 hypothetical protein M427DRAFT_27120 [Gonapodya prolifera JEL478]